MKRLKSYKLFEYVEITWKQFYLFVQEVQDVFVYIMDDKLLINDVGQYSFEYQDDFVFLTIKKPKDLDTFELWQDINVAIDRLKDKFKIEVKSSDLPDKIKLVIKLLE